MNKGLLVIAAAALLLVGVSVFFTVDQRELAIKLMFGRVVRSDYEPGLQLKWPWPFENVLKFDKRIQNWDATPERYLTVEKKNVVVDSFVKWRVADVERFFTATGGSVRRTSDRLSTIVQKLLKDEFGKRTVKQVIAGQRAEVMNILTEEVSNEGRDLGIEVVDVRIKRIDLPGEVSSSVYERMAAERKEVAKDFRSRGEEAAKIIRAAADRERAVILAEAERDGQQIRGEGDGTAAEIYADAYNQNPEFYSLYRSLNAYKQTFKDRSDILLLQPDAEFFRYFKDPAGGTPP